MKKVILTGANGFIGRHALKYLIKNNYDVYCVTTQKVKYNDSDVIWCQTDLLNEKECHDLFRSIRPTHLLHFAWYTEPIKYWSSDKNYDWIKASLNMLYYFHRYGGERATYAGTCAEYDWSYGVCSENKTPVKPNTIYGICKDRLRREATSFCLNNNVSFSWGRIFFLYGQNEHPSRLVSSVIISLLKNEVAKCTHGRQVRDFLYSEDVASAFVKLLDSETDGTINIGSGKPISIKEVIDKICQKIGGPELVRFGEIPVPVDDPPLIVADVTRLEDEVCWKPGYNLDTGLDKTIEWWKQNI